MEKKSRRPKKEEYRMRTHLIHGNPNSLRWDYDHHVVPPISASTTFRLNSANRGARGFAAFANETAEAAKQVPIYIYDRLDEPTRGMLEDSLAYAEGGETAVSFATGMAAISAALGVTVQSGQEIVAHRVVYGCTYSLLTNWLPRYHITTRFVDLTDESALRAALNDRTRVIYCETPVNPTLQLIDIAAVRRVADEANQRRSEPIRLIVDNTFATPYCQRPLDHGAHVVIHSLTKDIGGFGTDMGGVVIAPRELHNLLLLYRKDFGGVLSSRSAWAFLVYGLPTLATRMVNQQKSALKIAQFLEQHPLVAKVTYPGLESFAQRDLALRQMIDYRGKFAPGSMLYFTLRDPSGDNRVGEAFIDHIAEHAYTITLAVSLGQIKTLIENPYSMTHAALPVAEKLARGIEPGGIRLSVGLEDWQDIIDDLDRAFEAVAGLCKVEKLTPAVAVR
ncbi:MAG: PLP-dependent transferase [Deltaproteobacteria bacterium]|nr:PLP-dependent transferase [Deltaproteobacteria bacterium]